MWLGTGAMRRRGRACTGRSLEESGAAPQYPQILSWEVTAGRWSHDGSAWVQGQADQPRLYKDAEGNTLGYLIEGAETFHSAPWHDPAAAHSATDPAYIVRQNGTDTITYAGSHAQADIHGGTGRGVELTQGATANSLFTAANLKAAATGTGDIIRVEALFSIPVTTGVAGTIALRTSQGRNAVLDHDASGNITGWNVAPSPANSRGGFAEAGVKSDGNRYWFAWFETYATAAANVLPAIGLPTAISGRKVVVHDLRILLNPQTAPKAVPVLAANRIFAADTMVTSETGAKGVLFHRLGRCRTRVTNGRFSVATAWARSGPYIPYETRVEVIASGETGDVPCILPNEHEAVDFTPWPTNVASWTVKLGPGYYNHRFVPNFAHITPSYTITSAFKNDPALMAQVERFNTNNVYTSGSFTMDDLIVFSRASEVTTQLEQMDLPAGTASLHNFAVGGSISAQRSLFVGHPLSHSRARHEEQEDETDSQRVWVGAIAFIPKGGAGSSLNISGSHFWRLGRTATDTVANTNTLTVTAHDVYFDQIWSDCINFDSGIFTIDMQRVLFGRFTSTATCLYQSRKEIEVDTGSGWTPLSASGLTVANLPFGRKATYAGAWNFAASAFTPAPDPQRHVYVRYWKRGGWSTAPYDKPGYQWHSSQAHFPNEDRFPQAGDVYEIRPGAAPSADKPWIRLTYDLGLWSNASTYVPGSAPAITSTGTHGDCLQTSITTGTYESITGSDCVIMGRAQGMFLQCNATMGANDSDVKSAAFNNFIVVSDQSWAFYFGFSKTPGSLCTITNALTLPMTSRSRYANGTAGTLGTKADGPNNTIALGNVFAGYRSSLTGVSAANGGTLTGTHTRVGIGEISGYAVTPPSGTPRITDMLDSRWLDPFTYGVRGDIDPLDESFSFTPYAESVTGMALNSILASARGTHSRWNKVKAQIAKYHRKPDRTIMVAASSPVGTVVAANLGAAGWKPLWSGNEKGYFAIEGGQLKVAKALTGIDQCWLLETDRGELILLDIR